ncbi:LuxR family transcriptional regulator [Aureimonas sp. SA4125]|nr:LuxR family transcriptional regulator [Aureimonas sp. SA4125]
MTLMLQDVCDIDAKLSDAATLEGRLARAHAVAGDFGLTSLIYDYTPVPYSHDGDLINPSFLGMRGVPDDFAALWCEGGYYQIDPVQHLAFRSPKPFVWSYRQEARTVLNPYLNEGHAPVVDYVHATRITCGMTVPVHLPGGSCATVTGIRQDAEAGFDRAADVHLGGFTVLAHALHAALEPLFGRRERQSQAVRLSPRELECVRFAAEGLSAKEISLKLGRSAATVVMHLNAAARKLQARNRAQMVARAAHYRFLS